MSTRGLLTFTAIKCKTASRPLLLFKFKKPHVVQPKYYKSKLQTRIVHRLALHFKQINQQKKKCTVFAWHFRLKKKIREGPLGGGDFLEPHEFFSLLLPLHWILGIFFRDTWHAYFFHKIFPRTNIFLNVLRPHLPAPSNNVSKAWFRRRTFHQPNLIHIKADPNHLDRLNWLRRRS